MTRTSAQGWNTNQFGHGREPASSVQLPSGWQEPRTSDGRSVGTLLSPEGAGNRPSGIRRANRRMHNVRLERAPNGPPIGEYAARHRSSRPYLENCTVDASIFVAKLI